MAFSDDPVTSGLITSLARPGGNVTGTASLTSELMEKRFELLKQVVPQAGLFACIWESDVGDVADQGAIQVVDAKLGLRIQFHRSAAARSTPPRSTRPPRPVRTA